MAIPPSPTDDADAGDSYGEDEGDNELLALARKRFHLAEEAESEYRKLAIEDMKFLAGDQWPAEIKNQRSIENRPCLTINRLPQFMHQITNDQRQNRPAIKVNPVSDGGTEEIADIYQGVVRHIEYNSDADVAYDRAFEGAAGPGKGYFRIITDYCDPMSFNQELLIKSIPNANSVYLDPSHKEPDGSDANWGFVFDDLTKDEFNSQFPQSKMSDGQNWETFGAHSEGWVTEDGCRIAEYFYKTFKKITIIQATDASGQVITLDKSSLPSDPEQLPPGFEILAERESVVPAIKWAKINGVFVLERANWLGSYIPIIPVYGKEYLIDGKKIFEGIVRHAKDPQRQFNYWASAQTEMIALAPKAPFIGYAGQFEGYEDKWKTANTKNHAFLEVNELDESASGRAPLPQRNMVEPPVQAITAAKMQSDGDLKATTGIYDPTLGNRSNEISGIAIQRRNTQSQTSNFHFIDNLTRSLRHAGRILVELIPKVYDTPQVIRIVKEDGTQEMVQINQEFDHHGERKNYDLSLGQYDVTISTGPSYQTKRQEAVASMLDLAKAYPPIMQIAGDLLVHNMDWPGSEEIADRLKKSLPPQFQDQQDKNAPKIPPQAQAMIAKLTDLNQRLTQALNESTQKMNAKIPEIQSRERIKMMELATQTEIALAELKAQGAETLLEHQVGAIETRIGMLDANQSGNGLAAGATGVLQPGQNQPPTGGSSPGSSMGG